jgi:SAM-dependent methyltransferase
MPGASEAIGMSEKGVHEHRFWQSRAEKEGVLRNSHYERLYTTMFGLEKWFFMNRRLLDIGCGPRGSLEWATNAQERVGLDPLAREYREFGTAHHEMHYIAAAAEAMPFRDKHFDIVTSLNSLDHVDDVDATIREIGRVTRPEGWFLVEVEIGHEPTETEPISLWFDLLDDLAEWFEVVDDRRYEMPVGSHSVHEAFTAGRAFDESRKRHAGVLIATLRRRS